MNKEEIKKAKKVVFNETCKECYFPKRKCTSCVRDEKKKIKKYINELEQKESILDKVTDKLKEDIEIDKVEWYEDGKITEKQFKAKNVNRKEYAREILNIIEGGNNGK